MGVLCAETGSRWLLKDALPWTASTFGSQSLGCALAAVAFGMWAGVTRWQTRSRWVAGWPQWGVTALGTALVIAGPAVATEISTRRVGPNNATLALALTTVVVAVACSTAQDASGDDLLGILWPGLGGLAGLLLLVPEPNLSGWRPWVALATMPLAVGLGASLSASPGGTCAFARKAAIVWGSGLGSALAGIVFAGLSVTATRGAGPSPHWGAALLDGTGVILTLLSLHRLGTARWSAQFLLSPLVALVEGVLLLRPRLDGRSWLGFGLLLLGAVRLLVYRPPPAPRSRALC